MIPHGQIESQNYWDIECLGSTDTTENMHTETKTLQNNFVGLILKLDPKYSIDPEFFLYKSLTKTGSCAPFLLSVDFLINFIKNNLII